MLEECAKRVVIIQFVLVKRYKKTAQLNRRGATSY